MHSYFLAFLLLVLASFSCRAEVLVIGVEDTRYLPHYGVVDGEYQGLGRVVLDAFFASRGQAVRYRPLPVNPSLYTQVTQPRFAAHNVGLTQNP